MFPENLFCTGSALSIYMHLLSGEAGELLSPGMEA